MDINTFINEWGATVVIGVVIIGYLAFRWKRQRDEVKKNAQMVAASMPAPRPQKQANQPLYVYEQNAEVDLDSIFGNTEKEQKGSTVDKMRKTVSDARYAISAEDNVVEKDMGSELERIQAKLSDTQATRAHLKEHGMELAKIYKKYERRERQLALTLRALTEINRSQPLEAQVPQNRVPRPSDEAERRRIEYAESLKRDAQLDQEVKDFFKKRNASP